ncbi:MAG: SDR family oxidoreductase [Bacteroidota bacterium]
MSLNGKASIVTGAGRGIGRAIALILAKNGSDVVLSSRTQSELDTVAAQIRSIGRKAITVQSDVSRPEDVHRIVDAAIVNFGKIDILVNNAGIGTFSSVADMKIEDFDRMFAVNVRGIFLCTKTVLPTMIKQNRGNIINISSLAGRNSFKGGAGYSATKWALIGFSRSLMLEVRQHNIRVITLCPGSVDTSFSPVDSSAKNADRIPKADDIAQVVLDALMMPENVMVSEIDIRPTNPNW